MQAARVGAERWPASLSGDVYDMASQRVENVAVAEQLVDLARAGGVELTEYDCRMA